MKSWLIRKDPDALKDWKQEEKGISKDEMAGRHHQLNGHEFKQIPGDTEGQGSLACCNLWSHKESDMTDRLNNNLLIRWSSDNFSDTEKWKFLSRVWLFVNPWTVQSMKFSRPEHEWVAFPFFRDISNPGIKPRSPALQADSLPVEPQGKPSVIQKPSGIWSSERMFYGRICWMSQKWVSMLASWAGTGDLFFKVKFLFLIEGGDLEAIKFLTEI